MSFTVEHDDFSVTSSTAASEAALREAIGAPASTEKVVPEPEPPAEPAKPAAAEGEAAEPAEEPDPASEAGKALAKKRWSGEQKEAGERRINELTRKWRDQEREANDLRARLAAYEASKAPAAAPAAPVTDPNDPEPNESQFDTYEKWVRAQARWEARQEVKAATASIAQEQAYRGFTEAQTRVNAKAKEAHADFDATIEQFVQSGQKFSPFVSDVILNHPLGHEIAYALAKDPEAHARISYAPSFPVAGIEMGRFIAQLETARPGSPVAAAPPVTTAKPPIKPLGSSPVSTDDGPPAGDDLDAHVAYYNRKEKIPRR